ncbi:unnamed protein product [Prorocentrum cordatum]|uniref:Uncharacterized protein n=1 Tax=Prorocentrum cordatum TaxID=2364126 RepID=A0ABN9XT83_9DINO|nr:unnamed protein product [Polarella glacialis]
MRLPRSKSWALRVPRRASAHQPGGGPSHMRHFWDAPHGPRAAPLSRSARAPRRAVQRRQRRAREHAGRLCAAQQEGPPPQGGGRHARGQQHPEGLPQEHQAMLGPRCFVPK